MASVDANIQKEHSLQRGHLEKTMSSLSKRLASDNANHRDDNVRIMQVSSFRPSVLAVQLQYVLFAGLATSRPFTDRLRACVAATTTLQTQHVARSVWNHLQLDTTRSGGNLK